jgi:hypothetical protein
MALPLVIPELQFLDANGHPYAGGTLASFVPGTSTPKQLWIDPDQIALAPNPVILDSAGRCLLYGDGEYRLILRDSVGNEIWDIEATTIVSAAMAPVVEAATISDALALLGVSDLIAAEATARSAADSAEQTARIAADNAEASTRAAADTTNATAISTETTRAMAAEAALAGGALSGGTGYAHVAGPNIIQWGAGSATGGTGVGSVTFPIAFPSACQSFVAVTAANVLNLTLRVTSVSTTAAVVFIEDTTNTGGKDSQFFWSAFGA